MKNNSPIAILLATYNSEKYLNQQIDSILEQTNREWTLFIKMIFQQIMCCKLSTAMKENGFLFILPGIFFSPNFNR